MLFPAHTKTRGDVLLVPDLHARVSLFDKENKPIVHLGEDAGVAEEGGRQSEQGSGDPHAAEGVAGREVRPPARRRFDKDGNIFVVEWVSTGRVTFLKKVALDKGDVAGTAAIPAVPPVCRLDGSAPPRKNERVEPARPTDLSDRFSQTRLRMKAARYARYVVPAVVPAAAGCSEPEAIRVLDEPRPTPRAVPVIPAGPEAVPHARGDGSRRQRRAEDDAALVVLQAERQVRSGGQVRSRLQQADRFGPNATGGRDPITWKLPDGWSGRGVRRAYAVRHTQIAPDGQAEDFRQSGRRVGVHERTAMVEAVVGRGQGGRRDRGERIRASPGSERSMGGSSLRSI